MPYSQEFVEVQGVRKELPGQWGGREMRKGTKSATLGT